jgi:opacity protein-like surface antigen
LGLERASVPPIFYEDKLMCVVTAAMMTAAGVSSSAATAAAISANLTLASTAFQVYGQYQQGKAQQAQYDYQAQVDRNNAQIAEWQAQDALRRGEIEEKQHRIKVGQLAGRQRSVLAASGVDVSSGSALDILGDTAELGELDALTIRSNAAREAYNYRVQASNSQASSALSSLAGQNARTSSYIGATSSLLGGATSMADKWYKWTA